jgi:hypothetical protein
MAVESIGTLVPTKIPGYADAADIQAALRAYHYGSYTYDTTNSDTANLINPSIAYTLNYLQSQISGVGSGYVEKTSLTAKGALISASATSTVATLAVGANGTVLGANSATATGLEWITPVTASSTTTFTNKTLTTPVINNIRWGYTTTATAGGTTTLTNSSNYIQIFTGTLNQTVVMPVTSTLAAGQSWEIENNSTGTLTVNSSGGNLIVSIIAGSSYSITCIGTTLTTAADWNSDWNGASSITGTGANVLGTSPTLTTPTVTGLTLNDSSIIFEGSSADAFETTLTVTNPTADRTITLPDVTGTIALLSQVINNTLTTTTGDMIYASANNTPARLAVGSEGTVLKVVSGTPTWSPAPAALAEILMLGGM